MRKRLKSQQLSSDTLISMFLRKTPSLYLLTQELVCYDETLQCNKEASKSCKEIGLLQRPMADDTWQHKDKSSLVR